MYIMYQTSRSKARALSGPAIVFDGKASQALGAYLRDFLLSDPSNKDVCIKLRGFIKYP